MTHHPASRSMLLSAAILGVFAVAAFAAANVAGEPPVQDDQPPVTDDDYDHQWHSADYTISLDGHDGNGSGVNATYYILNGGPVMSVAVDGQPMITSENASNSLEYWSVDNDGNEETPHNMLNGIKLDKTAPEADTGEDLELPEVSAWMLSGLGSRDNLGIASYVWQIQNSSRTDVLEGSSTWYVFFYPGEYPVTLTVTDNADNVDTAEMLVVVYDSTYPELDIVRTMTVMVGVETQFSGWSCTDNVGIVSYYWDFGDGAESDEMNATHAYAETGKYFARLFVADEAGNEAFGSILVEVVPVDDGDSVPVVLYLAGAGMVVVGVVLATIGYMLLKRRKG